MATTWYTVIGFYVSTGRIFAFQVQAQSGPEAMWRVADDHDWMNDMEFLVSVEGLHLSNPEGTMTFAGESTVSGTTIREQPEVFGAPVSSPGKGKTATLKADDMIGARQFFEEVLLEPREDDKPCWISKAVFVVACAVGSATMLTLGVGGYFLMAMLAAG